MAEPHVGYLGVIDLAEDHLGNRERVISLVIERDRYPCAGCDGYKFGPGGNVPGKLRMIQLDDRTRTADPSADFAVMQTWMS